MISRLDENLELTEFKKLCAYLPGKAKTFLSLARYSDMLMKRQVLIGGFDNAADKKAFMNVFKMLYPEYWLQEVSKIVKFFCMSANPIHADCDWKEFF